MNIRNISLAGLIGALIILGGCIYTALIGAIIIDIRLHALAALLCALIGIGCHISLMLEINKMESK